MYLKFFMRMFFWFFLDFLLSFDYHMRVVLVVLIIIELVCVIANFLDYLRGRNYAKGIM